MIKIMKESKDEVINEDDDKSKPMREQGHYFKKGRIEIGDDVWIGINSIMLKHL